MSLPHDLCDDFIEYPALIRHPLDWKTKSADFPSDLKIIVHNGVGGTPAFHEVHLRILSMLSDFFYKFVVNADHAQSNSFNSLSDTIGDITSEGDISVRLQGGHSCRVGSLSQSVSSLKEQIGKLFCLPVHEQRLFFCHGDKELVEDWRSLAGCGLQKDDTLLLVQGQPWLQFEPSIKTLTLHLPEVCARCILNPFVLFDYCLSREDFLFSFALDRLFERLLEAMYRFGREPAVCLESFARGLEPDEALGALWLAGRLEMPALQEAAAARLREATAVVGETSISKFC